MVHRGLRALMLLTGMFAGARGACPVCGKDVELRHAFNGVRLTDSYGCYRCGPTTYSVRVSGA